MQFAHPITTQVLCKISLSMLTAQCDAHATSHTPLFIHAWYCPLLSCCHVNQAFNRRGVTAKFTSTATTAIPAPVKLPPFQLTRSTDNAPVNPSSNSLAIGGKSNELQLPEGSSVKARARLWQDDSGRVFLEATAVNSWPSKSTLWDRTYARVDGVEVRPYVQVSAGRLCH
jgi:hypothetical protein